MKQFLKGCLFTMITYADAINYKLYIIEKIMHSLELEISYAKEESNEIFKNSESGEDFYKTVDEILKRSESLRDFIEDELIEKYFGW